VAARYLGLRRGRRACAGMLLVIEQNAGWLYSISGSRVAVGLEFGTTFSEFAYSHISEPSKAFKFYDWPQQSSGDGQPY
jgi:hypothetical protein